jgi:predicted GNAT family N-acyltransferase
VRPGSLIGRIAPRRTLVLRGYLYLSRYPDGAGIGGADPCGNLCMRGHMTGASTRSPFGSPIPGVEIRRIRSARELEAAVALRREVFCEEQGVPVSEEIDGRDHQGLHLVAVAGGEVIATCRIVMVGSTAQFSRLAVRATARRQGIATALLEAADAETRAAGGRRIVLHAQTYARPLYENAGYCAHGRLFWEAGIEHVAMEKAL